MRRKGCGSRSLCLLPSKLPHTWFVRWKRGAVGLFMAISTHVLCGFRWKCFFKSCGDICWSPLPSLPLDELSIDERDSDGFISRLVVCRSIDSSLLTLDYQPSLARQPLLRKMRERVRWKGSHCRVPTLKIVRGQSDRRRVVTWYWNVAPGVYQSHTYGICARILTRPCRSGGLFLINART